ncbi:MAG: Cthe_2314 family HEPN domain-containing protein [Saprospiraceae bacterium]
MEKNYQNELYDSLIKIRNKRADYDFYLLNDLATAYNLKRKFSFQAGLKIYLNYKYIVETGHRQKKPHFDLNEFKFENPTTQLPFWVDVLLHNCRGSLETLAHLINYTYDLKIKQSKVTFYRVLNESKEKAKGIHQLLLDIYNDAWFTIITKLRNKSYHIVVNTFVPKIGIGKATTYSIRFPIDPLKGNLSHNSSLFVHMAAGANFDMASLELDEFSGFLHMRLEEYLGQVDKVLIEDCSDIAKEITPRSINKQPRLTIQLVNFRSWRNISDWYVPFGNTKDDKE